MGNRKILFGWLAGLLILCLAFGACAAPELKETTKNGKIVRREWTDESGSLVTGPDGYACLIDPAVYVGHAEADLAMTELFGGFAPAFYDAYREVNEVLPGYADRREIYNLYHLLNHLNLFGSAYYGAVMRIINKR